jgi:hypothetical protein
LAKRKIKSLLFLIRDVKIYRDRGFKIKMKKNFKFISKDLVILILIGIVSLNLFVIKYKQDIFTKNKKQLFSLNVGDSYFGRLNFWRLLVQNNDWTNAAKLESDLNATEIKDYKFNYQPSELQKKIDFINNKKEKSVEDYLEIGRLQLLLNQKQNSFESIKKARQLDPIRDDIDRLYYSLQK